jgi:hypothetical protein
METYPNVVAVTLAGNPNQMKPINGVDCTGHAVFSGTTPPAGDVQALAEALLLDMAALQAAVTGNPAIGQDAVVAQVVVGYCLDRLASYRPSSSLAASGLAPWN